MTGSLGFTVTEIVRRPEPVVPDPFVAALEPERGDDRAQEHRRQSSLPPSPRRHRVDP